MTGTWIVVESDRQLGAQIEALGGDGRAVTALVVGPRELAEAAAAVVGEVRWIDPGGSPAEAWAEAVAEQVAAGDPHLVVGPASSAGRVLLGRVAARLGTVLVGGVTAASDTGAGTVHLERRALSGRLTTTASASAPACVLVEPSDAQPATLDEAGGVTPLEALPADVTRIGAEKIAGGSGVVDAARVVSVGKGLKSKDDLAMVRELASALNAHVGCSMPVADDLGWVPKSDYVGRSGQHISPRLYLALGISGAPQHLEGIRDAKTVVAINSDKDAPIFTRADYGIVGDLYDIVPELIAAIG